MDSSIALKIKHADETRRTRLTPVTYAALLSTVSELLGLRTTDVKLSYVDADADVVTFSSDAELADAVAQLAASAPFVVHVTMTTTTPSTSTNNVWLELPAWVRKRLVENHAPGSDVNDASVWLQLTPDVQAKVTAKHAAKKLQQDSCCNNTNTINNTIDTINKASDALTPEASDQEMWARAPLWFKNKLVAKHAPGQSVDAFATFANMPEPIKARVRCRAAHWAKCSEKWAAKKAAKEAKAAAAAPIVDEASDRAMWAALPDWVRFKIAAKSAKKGTVVADPHDFATFQALPPCVQHKVRIKASKCAAKCAKWAHKQETYGARAAWWRSAQTSATTSVVAPAVAPQPAGTFTFTD